MNYYKQRFNMSDTDITSLVEAFVRKYPAEITNLTGIAMSTQSHKINKLHQTQGVLQDNHLFLYDVLSNSEASLQEKLNTKYTKIPEDLAFKDQKILDLLEEK